MRFLLTLLLVMGFSTSGLAADVESAGSTHGQAAVLPTGDWEVGLYAPLRRGFSNDVELSVHPLVATLSPHIIVKKRWHHSETLSVASQHSLVYPTPMLRALAREGTGGVIVADATIPTIIATDNRLITTHALNDATALSIHARLMLGVSGSPSDWPSLDMPLAYTRTAAYRDNISTSLGAQLDGRLRAKWGYRLQWSGWLLPLSETRWATELKPTLHWRPSSGFTVRTGALGVMGSYPYGRAWHVLPVFDLMWRW